MIAFVMNAVAWEPVIKETHWFGMYEYYSSSDASFNVSEYLDNTDFLNLDGWTIDLTENAATAHDLIGECKFELWPGDPQYERIFTSTVDNYHKSTEFCIGLEARYNNNNNTAYASFTQRTKKPLPSGNYRLIYDVQNVNSDTEYAEYDNRFYVQIGDDPNNRRVDSKSEWMDNGGSRWTTHTIEFYLGEDSYITISLGYGSKTNKYHTVTPALFVSNLEFQKFSGNTFKTRGIIRNSTNSEIIEAIEVAKWETGQDPPQCPKTSYYSWIDRQFRFSTNRTDNTWTIDKNNSREYEGFGLKNTDATAFKILNLQAGDKFSVEYYLDSYDSAMPYLANGNSEMTGTVKDMTPDQGAASVIESKTDYEVATAGNVQILMPVNAVIRSVTITYPNERYQKAEVEVKPLNSTELQEYGKPDGAGYRYSFSKAGVLEDKRGAVPYITMRFGAENDMTFVRKLGDGKYGASSIIDENNSFNPGDDGAKLQYPYRAMSESFLKKWLAGKEWSVFTSNLNDEGDGEDFNSIYPLYGSYYYFFPEVNGRLVMEFYCEGSEESPAFWYKINAKGEYPAQPDVIKKDLNGNDLNGYYKSRTNGSNYYRFTVDVEKGGVYYLCSLPTNIAHEHPIIRLTSYAFIPSFRLDPLWYVATDAEKEAKAVNNASTLNQDFTTNGTKNLIKEVKCLGNIHSANAYFVADNANNKAYLNINNIVYNSEYENDPTLNDGGAVVVTVECEEGKAKYVLTVPYSAEKAVASTDNNNHYLRVRDTDATRNPNGKEVKKWDFFSQIYEVGQYSNRNSQLYNEIHKPDGLTADWVESYVNIEKSEVPIFKSVYDMEGDNADMLHETNGLVFFADANVLGIYNENNPSTTSFADRYIGLMNGGEFWIPNLKEGDRVVIKMGVYGKSKNTIETQNATLHIENAQDAVGTALSSGSGDNIQYYDYVIGGSGIAAGNDLNNGTDIKDKSQPWGEYHFISTGGHFKLKVAETTELLKIYSIVIYKNSINPDNILTENELLGDEEHLQILNTQDFTTAVDEVLLHLHYRGLNEVTNYAQKKALTGNLIDNDIARGSQTSNNALWYTFSVNSTDDLPITPDKAKFGVFRARLGVQTIGNGDYVTDYADAMIPVGYRETKKYPYTWDFTDLKKYVSAGIDNNGTEKEVADANADLRIWNNWSLRVAPEKCDGNIFASGGQLYGGKTMFDETRGIGITYDNNNNVTTMTGTSTDETGGLAVNGEGTYGFIVPQVDKEQAIYVRAAKVGSTQSANYTESKGYPTYTYEGQSSEAFPYSAEATDGSGDWVFALVMQNKNDVRLNFKGYEVKKIAVSTDPKAVNIKGWSTESRGRDIDASLTSYMTGKDIKTYVVTNIDYSAKTVTLTDVSDKRMPKADADGSSNACILHYSENTELKTLGDGFHLFVPDMHDLGKAVPMSSLMEAKLDAGPMARENGDMINHVFTYQYQKVDPKGEPLSGMITGEDMAFYRVSRKVTINSTGNQGYLPISVTEGGGEARFAIIFEDGNDEATGVEQLQTSGVASTAEPTRYYNMNGQLLNGKPNRSGLYIVNGKKISIKNK